jgi:hypothetical protein
VVGVVGRLHTPPPPAEPAVMDNQPDERHKQDSRDGVQPSRIKLESGEYRRYGQQECGQTYVTDDVPSAPEGVALRFGPNAPLFVHPAAPEDFLI